MRFRNARTAARDDFSCGPLRIDKDPACGLLEHAFRHLVPIRHFHRAKMHPMPS
jgi:hypothetical protein